MFSVFDVVPSDFFTVLGSKNRNQAVYSELLLKIYNLFDNEISYRILRDIVRDTIAAYLLENHIEIQGDDASELGLESDWNIKANFIIRRFVQAGWLEEETDDTTLEKTIVMPDNGIALAQFIEKLKRPTRLEFSVSINTIFYTLEHWAQGEQNPYKLILTPVYDEASKLSSALKKLATSIKKIIEGMLREGSLVSLTENIIKYCDGDFIKEYSRLVQQQNIHLYREKISRRLEDFKGIGYFGSLTQSVMDEEGCARVEAEDKVLRMLDSTRRFIHDDYNKIMKRIKDQINAYIKIAIARERILRNKGKDNRGNVEETIRYLVHNFDEDKLNKIDEEIQYLFHIHDYEFVDKTSLQYPHKNQSIQSNIEADVVEMSVEERERQKRQLQKESYNPYSKELMKKFLDSRSTNGKFDSSNLTINEKKDVLASMAAVTYARENGYLIEIDEDFVESDEFKIRHWRAKKDVNN
ncbi:Wadjet anti-phage system protein JetA family protein [uncultured Fibrobacter sp.]|uniref:Wadjet anti-phage system protein JetA family protein n=1 Tax=uncultured Fibrobacter sp. TaxID=261512 RepID=UPI0025EF5552|nr:Wadjet anti-phage system protein JetA family protein [uncultured Fibrobacter sp.]